MYKLIGLLVVFVLLFIFNPLLAVALGATFASGFYVGTIYSKDES